MKAPPGNHGQFHDDSDSHPILACRRRSRSMWLHFPHLELLFLFWAFEGAVAAQVSALKDAACPRVFWLALAALVRVGGMALGFCFLACRLIIYGERRRRTLQGVI